MFVLVGFVGEINYYIFAHILRVFVVGDLEHVFADQRATQTLVRVWAAVFFCVLVCVRVVGKVVRARPRQQTRSTRAQSDTHLPDDPHPGTPHTISDDLSAVPSLTISRTIYNKP